MVYFSNNFSNATIRAKNDSKMSNHSFFLFLLIKINNEYFLKKTCSSSKAETISTTIRVIRFPTAVVR